MQNLRELISKALDEMKLQGASAKQLHIYRTTSFGNILRYFNQKMITDINADMLDDYLSEMYTDYLANSRSSLLSIPLTSMLLFYHPCQLPYTFFGLL